MQIPIKKIIITILILTITVLGAHLLILYLRHFQGVKIPPFLFMRFFIDYEGNVPTWLSSSLLFSVGISAITVSFLSQRIDGISLTEIRFWKVFSFIYFFFSFDETAQIHEIIDNLTNIKWVKVYAPFAVAFLIYCLYYFFIRKKENKVVRSLILGGLGVYLLGGLVVEYVGHVLDLDTLGQHIELAFEEGLELLGSIIVLSGSLVKLNSITSRLFWRSNPPR